MPTESAIAYVSIIPSARGFGSQLERQIDPSGLGTSLGNQVSGGLTSSIKKGLQGAATGTIAAAAGAIGTALVKGFSRLTSIDQATAKLRGLGNSAQDISKIMDNALGAVRGTAFGLDAASTVAAAAVASGIKPGKDLEGVLKTIADTATIAGASMEDTGAIFNSVAARGKLQGDDLMQLQSRGVPVLAFLAKHYGTTAQAASDMVSKGKVDFENFAAAMQENLGGAALSSGDTFTGAMANVFASLGRIGANLEKGFFPKLAPLFQTITATMGPLEDRAGQLGKVLGDRINPALDKLSHLLTNGTNAFKGIGSVLAPLGGAFAALGAGGLGGLLAVIPGLGGLAGPLAALGGPIGIIAGALGGLVAVSPDLQAALSTAGNSIGSFATTVGGAFAPVLSAVLGSLGYLVDELGSTLATAIQFVVPVVLQLAGVLGASLAPLLPVVGQLFSVLSIVLANIAPLFVVVAQIAGQLVTAFAPLLVALGTALAGALTAVLPLIADLSFKLVPLANFISRNSDLVIALGLAVAGGVIAFKAWKAVTGVLSGVQQVLTARTYGVEGATYAQATAGRVAIGVNKALTLSSKIAAGAQLLFNGALRANPIGLIITAIGALVAGLTWFFTQTKLGQSIVHNVFAAIQVAVQAVGDVFMWLWTNAVKPAWDGIAAGATWLWQNALKPAFDGIVLAAQTVGGWFKSLWTDYIAPPLTAIGNAVSYLYSSYIDPIFQLIGAILTQVVGPAFSALWTDVIQPVFGWIGGLISTWWTATQIIFGAVVGFVRDALGGAFNWLSTTISDVFNYIGLVFSVWWNTIVMPIFNAVVGFLRNTLGPVFTWLHDAIIAPVFNAIGTVIRGVWEGWIKPVFDRIIDIAKVAIPAAFTVMKDGIGKAWDLVKDVVKAPIRFVVQTVINDGIIGNFNKAAAFFGTKKMPPVALPKGFSEGGYTGAGAKYQPAGIVHAGEYVFTKEQTARLGVGRLAAIANNGYAKGGLVTAATGGWDWLAGKAGKAWDWAKDAAGTAASVVSDPMGTLGKLVNGMVGQIPGAGAVLDLAKGFGKKILDGAIEKLKGIGDLGGVGAFGGNGQNGNIPSSSLGKALGFAPGAGVGPTGGLLTKAAANAWNSAFRASGGALSLTEGYRDLKAQQYRWSLFKKGGNLAAAPGTSKHGLGLAADVAGGQAWLRANGAKFGWANTGLGFSQREPWHFEFKGRVPQMANGGIVSRRPGGILANLGEGRYDEAVVPLTPQVTENLTGANRQVSEGPKIGHLTLVSASGNVKEDLDDVDHKLESMRRGGRL
jgi:tape measure domain-containing protein